MAEFQIVARAYIRMCDSYSTSCEGCPINVHDNDTYTCRCRVLRCPCKYESKIMAWAAEHPELVYPTWYEYLSDYYRAAFGDMSVISKQPIPADIAQKLGIEPKEGTQ